MEGETSEKTKNKVTLPIPITVAVYHTQYAPGLIQKNVWTKMLTLTEVKSI